MSSYFLLVTNKLVALTNNNCKATAGSSAALNEPIDPKNEPIDPKNEPNQAELLQKVGEGATSPPYILPPGSDACYGAGVYY